MSNLSRDHGVGEVPRRDHGGDADGLPDEDELLAVGGRGDDVAFVNNNLTCAQVRT